jgi:hypothetical protein
MFSTSALPIEPKKSAKKNFSREVVFFPWIHPYYTTIPTKSTISDKYLSGSKRVMATVLILKNKISLSRYAKDHSNI